MRNRLLIIIFLSAFFPFVSFAQEVVEKPVEKESNHNVGFVAGYSTGLGLSYKYENGKNGVQFSFLPIISENFTFVSLGCTLMHTFYEAENSGLFVYQGNHLIVFDESTMYVAGLGVGMDFTLTKKISFSLMGGYALNNYERGRLLSMSLESGLFYKF